MRFKFSAWIVFWVTVMLVVLVASLARADSVGGIATNMGSLSSVPYGYAATHHGDSQWTFKDGAVLLVSGRGSRTLVVRVVDVCAGSSCRMLDLSLAGFEHLGYTASQGIGRVSVSCGRAGFQPIRKCLAGEDK